MALGISVSPARLLLRTTFEFENGNAFILDYEDYH
jgi:hypothetical protein